MREVISLNRKWAFTKRMNGIPTEFDTRWNLVNLPHTWNNIDGQDGGGDYYRGVGYYVKKLHKEDLPKGDKYFLEFMGANSEADVYINGKKIAHHEGGYSIWRVEITEELEEENLLVVAVDNGENNTVYPQMADFTFYGGLYRDVNLIVVQDSHFELEYYGSQGIKVTPVIREADAQVHIDVYLSNMKPSQSIIYRIYDREEKMIMEARSEVKEMILTIPQVHLWWGRRDPYLYKAEALLMEGDIIIDNISTKFGCRSFYIDSEKGFFLNGERYPLRGVSRHQDRWGLGSALLPEHHRADMEMIWEMGANTIRLAHYQHDQYFYDLCDQFGMIVWAEIPYISKHMPGGRENTVSQMKELIIQNYNHPSIVVWGLSNEITISGSDVDLLENHRILNDLAHELDKTRLTTIACVSMCDPKDPYIQIPDVVSYNHYFGWYGGDTSMNGPWFDKFHADYPHIPIGCSEYGCEALNWHTSNPVQGDYTEEYQAYYHEELIKQLFTREYLWATHVWNMFDFGADARNEGGENGQNHKGLVTFDRKYKKDAFYAYKAWLSKEPFVHICGKRYVNRVEDISKVTVYSNQPEVELFINGKSLEKQRSENHFFYFQVPNEGKTVLRAVAGECQDSTIICRVDTFDEAYRLKEKGAILNWFDISAPEGYYSLNDTLGEIRKCEQGCRILEGLMAGMQNDSENPKAMGFEINEGMMKMMEGFTVIRMANLMGTAGIKISKEQLLALNKQLNQIRK